jgi:cellulose synthase operon protein C
MSAVEDLVALLQQGKSPTAALAAVMPASESELLKLCSVVRTFDAPLIELLTAEGPVDAGIEPLLELGFGEAVPDLEGVYRLRDTIRSDNLRRWWDDDADTPVPARLAELSRRLVEEYDKRGEPVEALYHELAADPSAAIPRFEALYAAADAAFDLPRCRDLVDVLGERLPMLGTAGGELRNRYRRYLDARGFWLDDWYRTARFLEPRRTHAAIEELLRGDERALQLWARGGMGKTILLRWLIARKCVPEPERIACARVDFDMIDAVAAVHAPGLVLLELAAQLNQQLDEAPFLELLREHGHLRERLRLRPAPASSATPTGSVTPTEADDIRTRVELILAELPPSKRVLLVLDTLEVALLVGAGGRSDALVPLLEAVAQLHDQAPAARVILSGRYDLSERVDRFSSLFPTARSVEVSGFEDDEARHYLVEKRELEQGPVLESAVQAAGGTPFKLALIADVVEQRPDLTAEEIAAYEDVDVAYLIERVVQRVEHDVQWVLRYGVVPRVLDIEFVREVMRPHLLSGMSGRTTSDAPGEDALPPRAAGASVFRTDLLTAGDDVDVDSLWSALRRYAGTSSWVNVDRDDSSLLRFHPDVVNPMRRLVSRHSVFDDLQRAACTYFERKARDHPEAWARWMREAIFHRFQLEGPRGGVYWREQLERARESGNVEARRELAGEPLGQDYLDEGEPRPWRRGRPVVDRATHAEALFEHAWADVQLAQDAGRQAEAAVWTAAEQQLALIESLQGTRSRPLIARSRLALVRTPISLVRGRHEEARAELELALRGRPRRDDRLWLLVQFADAVAQSDPDAALERLDGALELATSPEDVTWRSAILHRLARGHAAVDDLVAALAACDEARGIEGRVELELLRGELALRAMALDTAAEAVTAARALGATVSADLLEGRVQLARWEPERAIEIAEQALSSLADSPPGLNELTTQAELVTLRGDARARLLDVDGALGDFVEAGDLWSEAGEAEGKCEALYKRAKFVLRELGDLKEAALALEQAERAANFGGANLVRATRLLRAEASAREGDIERARQLVDEIRAEIAATPAPPHELVAVELTALSVAHVWSDGLLIESLARVKPSRARLGLLEPLERCSPLEASAEERERLRRLVPAAEQGAPLALAFADLELDRVLGRGTAAARKLENLRAQVGGNAYAQRRWLESASRLEERVQVPSAWAAVAAAAGAASPVLTVAAAVALGALVGSGAFQDLLERARQLLDRDGAPAGAWRAQLHEAAARAARESSDVGEERRQLELAAEVYSQLGDRPAHDRVLGGAEATQPQPHLPDHEPAVLFGLKRRGKQLEVEVQGPGSAPKLELHDVRAVTWALGTSQPPFAKLAAAAISDWEDFRADLGSALMAGVAESPAPLDLRLRIEDVVLGSIPWELARTPDGRSLALHPAVRWLYRTTRSDEPSPEDVRGLQVALREALGRPLPIDGILGPATVSALAEFQKGNGLPPSGVADRSTRAALGVHAGRTRSVALVTASRAVEELAYRGSSQAGLPLAFFYSRAGLDVRELGNTDLDVLKMRPARIIHITAAITEARGGGVELDFGADPEGRYGKAMKGLPRDYLGSSALDHALRGIAPKPIVILDIPAPPSDTEAVTQLFLRNAFAGDLLALGNVEAVIGTGLARYRAQEPLYHTIVDGLGGGKELGEIATAIRRLGSDGGQDIERALAFDAVALFARRGDATSFAV